MDGEDRSRLVDIANQRLAIAVDDLASNAIERMLDGDLAPVDGSGFQLRAQKTNQPQKSASASRKKKTLETPPPKIR